jgi:hypothetical protein
VDSTRNLGVRQRYYQKWGHFEHSYVFLKRFQVVFWMFCNVREIKFLMVPTTHRVQGNDFVYMLLEHAKDGIKESHSYIGLNLVLDGSV